MLESRLAAWREAHPRACVVWDDELGATLVWLPAEQVLVCSTSDDDELAAALARRWPVVLERAA